MAEAEARLSNNGVILTGIDTPTDHGAPLPFFGRTTRMPTLHAELAIRHGSPTALLVPNRNPNHRYSVTLAYLRDGEKRAVTRTHTNDLAMEILTAAEMHISIRPAEWRVLRPVWPDLVAG